MHGYRNGAVLHFIAHLCFTDSLRELFHDVFLEAFCCLHYQKFAAYTNIML